MHLIAYWTRKTRRRWITMPCPTQFSPRRRWLRRAFSQQEVAGRGAAYITPIYNYSDTAYGASIEDHDRFVKVLADPETEEILGCHVIGTEAATLIQEVANATRSCVGVDAILQSIYVHPALPELVQRAFGGFPVWPAAVSYT